MTSDIHVNILHSKHIILHFTKRKISNQYRILYEDYYVVYTLSGPYVVPVVFLHWNLCICHVVITDCWKSNGTTGTSNLTALLPSVMKISHKVQTWKVSTCSAHCSYSLFFFNFLWRDVGKKSHLLFSGNAIFRPTLFSMKAIQSLLCFQWMPYTAYFVFNVIQKPLTPYRTYIIFN